MTRRILSLLILVALAAAWGAPVASSWNQPAFEASQAEPVGAPAFPEPSQRLGSLPAAGGANVVPEPIGSVAASHTETVAGTWAYANPSHGSAYLAIPEGRGWIVWVCGPLDCFERVSTDAGPELYLQRQGRIGDLSSRDFERACGPLSVGLCSGSYAILGAADQSGDDPAPHPDDQRMRAEDVGQTAPPTDTTGGNP